MKIKIKIQKKDFFLFLAVCIFFIAITYVIAYGSSNPVQMGHSIGELGGVQARITGTCSSGNAIRVVNADGTVACQSASGGAALPSGCASNQVAKWNGVSWICSNDIDTDTKCNVAGSCTQVCIGDPRITGNCKRNWPPGADTYVTCDYGDGASDGNCNCGTDRTVLSVYGACYVSSPAGSCSANGDNRIFRQGECCVCDPV